MRLRIGSASGISASTLLTSRSTAVFGCGTKIVDTLPAPLIGIRDRALLLVGYAGGFRRSELARLAMEDASFTEDGLILNILTSKTDQEGQGRKIGIPRGSHPDSGCDDRGLFRGHSHGAAAA